MSYLKTILFIFLAITAATSFYFLFSGKERTDRRIVLTVNGKSFSQSEINNYFSGRLFEDSGQEHHNNRRQKLETFAGERVLIQEAENNKIDQEEDFRLKIQRYYEYSLISALRNKQENKFRKSVTEESLGSIDQSIDHFIDLYGRQITYSVSTDSNELTILFDMIPNMYKPVIADLKAGESREVVFTGNSPHQITLHKIGPKTSELHPEKNRQKIKQMILDYRIETKLGQWEKSLIEHADIQYTKEN